MFRYKRKAIERFALGARFQNNDIGHELNYSFAFTVKQATLYLCWIFRNLYRQVEEANTN